MKRERDGQRSKMRAAERIAQQTFIIRKSDL